MSLRVRKILGWTLTVLLAALFVLASTGKLTGAATEMFAGWGYPAWFAVLIGVLELAGGVGLLIPMTRTWAILGLSVVMVGAAYTHLAAGETAQVLRPLLFMAGLWVACWLMRTQKEHPVATNP